VVNEITASGPSLVSVTVSPEWDAYPLWIEYSREDPRENSAVHVLTRYGVDPALASSIDAWDEIYQSVFNRQDPNSSGFDEKVQTDAWLSRGIELTRQLSTQLPPGIVVRFRKVGQEVRFMSPSSQEEFKTSVT